MEKKIKIGIGVILVCLNFAYATTMIPLRIEELIDNSSLIIIGEVLSIEAYEDQNNGIIHREVSVIPLEILKGKVLPNTPIVVDVLGGTIGERTVKVPGSPEFEIGEKVLLFLRDYKDGKKWVRGLGQGKFSLVETPEGVVAMRNIEDIFFVSREGELIDIKSSYRLEELKNLIKMREGQ